MAKQWVIMHVDMKAFFRFPLLPARRREALPKPSWTIHINKARVFPSETAALAVRSEWDLERISRIANVCPSED